MEIRGREIVYATGRVLMTPIDEVAVDDATKALVEKQLSTQSIERGRPSRDARSDENATSAQHARGLGERLASILCLDEMVEWPKQEHHVHGVVRVGQRARISYGARCESMSRVLVARARDVDQPRRRIHQP